MPVTTHSYLVNILWHPLSLPILNTATELGMTAMYTEAQITHSAED